MFKLLLGVEDIAHVKQQRTKDKRTRKTIKTIGFRSGFLCDARN